LDTLAVLGARDGYLTASLGVIAPEPGSAELSRVGEACRFTEAVRQAGGAVGEGLWQFPVSTHPANAGSGKLLPAWDRLHGGRAADQLLAQLVLAIRMYRPDVVLTDNPGEAGAAASLVAEAVREAFRRAGDAGACAEQISSLGLEAHKA